MIIVSILLQLLVVMSIVVVIVMVPQASAFLPTSTTIGTTQHATAETTRNSLGMVEIPKGPAPLYIVTEDEDGNVVNATPLTPTSDASASTQQQQQQKPVVVVCPDCDLCDGSGRISGGIGAVLDWWPIKAYRPCPNFIERGGKYARSGQGLDEIAFGRDSKFEKQ